MHEKLKSSIKFNRHRKATLTQGLSWQSALDWTGPDLRPLAARINAKSLGGSPFEMMWATQCRTCAGHQINLHQKIARWSVRVVWRGSGAPKQEWIGFLISISA